MTNRKKDDNAKVAANKHGGNPYHNPETGKFSNAKGEHKQTQQDRDGQGRFTKTDHN